MSDHKSENPPTRPHYICTADDPWKPEYGLPVVHDAACEVGSGNSGDTRRMRCPHCGAEWREVLLWITT